MADNPQALTIDKEAAIAYWGNDNPPLELTAAFTAHRLAVIGLVTDWLVNARYMNVTASEIEARFAIDPRAKGVRCNPSYKPAAMLNERQSHEG